MHIWVYVHVSTYTRIICPQNTYTCIHQLPIHEYTRTSWHAYMIINSRTRTHTCTMHTHVHIYIYIYIYIYMHCTCVCIHVLTHIHTHIVMYTCMHASMHRHHRIMHTSLQQEYMRTGSPHLRRMIHTHIHSLSSWYTPSSSHVCMHTYMHS